MDNRFRFTVGDFSCLAIRDGGYAGTAAMLFDNAPEAALQQALREHGLAPDHLPSTWTCLLVQTAGHLVLIDTGGGKLTGEAGGRLASELAAESIHPGDVDIVILTHGHTDHIGGCVDADGRPAFPNAQHLMWHSEWEYWRSEANLAQMSEWSARVARTCLPPLAPQMETIRAETEIVPGIRAVAAPGHTVGHMAVEIRSAGKTLLNMADGALHPIHLAFPEWVATLDGDPEQTVSSRRALCRRAADKNALVLAFHFPPFPSLGYVVEEGEAWRWDPVSTSEQPG